MATKQNEHLIQPSEIPDGVPVIACDADEGFKNWMSQYGGSLILSTLEDNRVAILGWDGRQVTLLLRQFSCPSGIAVRNGQILLATRQCLTLFNDAHLLAYDYDPKNPGLYDACFLPRATWYVGDVQPRQVCFLSQGMAFVNTLFSCLAQPSFLFHFESLWKPPFVTDLEPDDRCHPSGLAAADGELAYATVFAESNKPGGWRKNRADSGIVMDTRTNQVLVHRLSLPHSPVWYRGCLWFLNSGAGELWMVHPRTNETKVVCSLPGFVRGLDFWREYAIIGLSHIRKDGEDAELPIEKKDLAPVCGVAVVNVLTGQPVGIFHFTTGCREIYEVRTLPQVRRAAMLTLDKPLCHEAVTTAETAWWMRHTD